MDSAVYQACIHDKFSVESGLNLRPSRRPILKQDECYFGMNIVTLNQSPITRTIPELTLASQNFGTTPTEGSFSLDITFIVYQVHITKDLRKNRVSNSEPLPAPKQRP
ncbi:hypothetical protein AVEN_58314-1 [Araneus ventricosus]|uniref:Uncharacterized protein n=1 Tax=Araneus ventricosus TaxID=182803 RepID=A0A4Y2CPW3_ARAVE|nr:hypothetical protein AVEN_58314-1 [Araneus ventricosus]